MTRPLRKGTQAGNKSLIHFTPMEIFVTSKRLVTGWVEALPHHAAAASLVGETSCGSMQKLRELRSGKQVQKAEGRQADHFIREEVVVVDRRLIRRGDSGAMEGLGLQGLLKQRER